MVTISSVLRGDDGRLADLGDSMSYVLHFLSPGSILLVRHSAGVLGFNTEFWGVILCFFDVCVSGANF